MPTLARGANMDNGPPVAADGCEKQLINVNGVLRPRHPTARCWPVQKKFQDPGLPGGYWCRPLTGAMSFDSLESGCTN